jgi:hypothetical protein
MNDQQPRPKRKTVRGLLAFIWLTIGYFFVSFLVPFILVFLPYATSSSEITHTSGGGVHTISFHGTPGDVIVLLVTATPGPKRVMFDSDPEWTSSSSTHMQWASAFFQLLPIVVFALLSIPVLKALFRHERSE